MSSFTKSFRPSASSKTKGKHPTTAAVQPLARADQQLSTHTKSGKINTNPVKNSRPESVCFSSSRSNRNSSTSNRQQVHRNSVLVRSSAKTGSRHKDLLQTGHRTLGLSIQDLSDLRMNEAGGSSSFTLPRGFHSQQSQRENTKTPQTKDDSVLKPYVRTGPKRTAPQPPPPSNIHNRQIVSTHTTGSLPRRKAPLPPTIASASVPSRPSNILQNTSTGTDSMNEANDCLYELPSTKSYNTRRKPPLPSSVLAQEHPPPVPNSPRPSFRSMSVSQINLMEDTDSIYETTNSSQDSSIHGDSIPNESAVTPPPLPPRIPSATKLSSSSITSVGGGSPTMTHSRPPPPIPARIPLSFDPIVPPPPLPPVSRPPLFKPPSPPPINEKEPRLQEDDAYMEMTLASTPLPSTTGTNEHDGEGGDDEYILMGTAIKSRDKYLSEQEEQSRINSCNSSGVDDTTVELGQTEEDSYMEMNALTKDDSYVRMIPSREQQNSVDVKMINSEHVPLQMTAGEPPPPLPPKPTVPTVNQTMIVRKHLRSVPKQRLSAPHLPPPPPVPVKSALSTALQHKEEEQLYDELHTDH